MTGHYVSLTELQDRMTIDDVYDLNLVLNAEAAALERWREEHKT